MHALVTGGGGFLGCYIVEQLRERGATVRVFSRSGHDHLRNIGVEHLRGDVRDPAAIRQACQGMDIVFHTAAIPGIWGRWSDYTQPDQHDQEGSGDSL